MGIIIEILNSKIQWKIGWTFVTKSTSSDPNINTRTHCYWITGFFVPNECFVLKLACFIHSVTSCLFQHQLQDFCNFKVVLHHKQVETYFSTWTYKNSFSWKKLKKIEKLIVTHLSFIANTHTAAFLVHIHKSMHTAQNPFLRLFLHKEFALVVRIHDSCTNLSSMIMVSWCFCLSLRQMQKGFLNAKRM